MGENHHGGGSRERVIAGKKENNRNRVEIYYFGADLQIFFDESRWIFFLLSEFLNIEHKYKKFFLFLNLKLKFLLYSL